MNAIPPMLDDIEGRTGQLPKVVLADANHTGHESIRAAASRGVELLAPVPERSQRPGEQAATDEAIAAWRARMSCADAQTRYRARAGLCELTNAHLRSHHGVDRFLVRGIKKVTSVVLMAAIASNLLAHATAFLA
jgi:hypothetical protein